MPTQNMRDKRNVEAICYLTALQEGMLSYGLAGGRDPYYTQKVFELDGALDERLFWRAWQTVVARHPVLRTDVRWKELDRPVQVVYRDAPLDPVVEDWRESNGPAGAETQTERLAREWQAVRDAGYRFDRSADLDARLIRIADSRRWFVWRFHHLQLDGWSFAMVLGDVLRAYDALVAGQAPVFDPAPGFQQYVKWLTTQSADDDWWRTHLAGFDAPTALPSNVGGGSQPGSGFAERGARVPRGRTAALAQFARAHRLTVSTLLQGAWAWVLAAHAGTRDVVFGVTVSGRPAELDGVERIAGLFINTLPCRVTVDGADGLVDWLRSLQQATLEIGRRAHHPLATIRRQTSLSAEQPLFDTALVFENFPVDRFAMADSSLSIASLAEGRRLTEDGYAHTTGRNHYPVSLIVVPGDELEVAVAYDTSRIDHPTAGLLLDQVIDVLGRFVDPAAERVADLAPRVAAEPPVTPSFEPVPDRVRRYADTRGDACAIRDENDTLTWAELWTQSGRLARALRERGVRAQDRVAVCLPRSAALVVALLATWRVRAVYVPLDPNAPAERLAWQIADCGARCAIADADADAPWRPQQVALAHPDARFDGAPLDDDTPYTDGYAYLIYTSGSTGRPKGVAVSHAAVSAYLDGVTRCVPDDIRSIACVSTPAADLGYTALFGALWNGWTLHLIGDERALDPDRFADYMRRHAVDALKIVPGHFGGLMQAAAAADAIPARCLILGGEATPRALALRVASLKPSCRIVNHYGPTETTIGAVAGEIDATEQGGAPALGRPLRHASLHVLNADGDPAPAGAVGEIHIGGAGVAAGYWARPSLTAARFVPDPWSVNGARLYRTGDLGRRLPGGAIQFVGRADDQVKIRGFRIEPQEIAGVLRTLDGVRDAAVLALRKDDREATLAAWACGTGLDADALRTALRERLPGHMVPSSVQVVDALPLTPNGKLDRAALAQSLEHAAGPAAPAAPRTPTEATLLAVWQQVLQRADIGVHDAFLDVGGDSILSLQIIAKARRAGLKISPKDMLAFPSVARLAEHVDQQAKPEQQAVAATLQRLIEAVK
ncbi:non-ribosomal peptide synthetase [Paraburkholderia caballeronis]|uniref:non-ribosomal peptide synthetase n=1 Tax=Paraburkholderia caballeronis TaxID=416943 RepID=UPI0010D1B793|nr:non-ribosomal peptide synthetase [Paraburkholderia caballeronis]TDV01425.1 amino acid adenylation domain-containing protein [Paraburkholderia caballeronis]TDV06018.1 amino acid adenylation domain-containing protein [Paraburkholderia caballeronis]TDV15542.1 amino acid adenylation domain-containing protein [Paraburkholderia caballeronis]